MKILINFIIFFKLLYSAQSFVVNNTENDLSRLPEVKGDKFYYFGYGSNMLTKRIHIQNPTAAKIGPGILKVSQ